MLSETVAEAPAASAPTEALPATVPSTVKLTVLAGEAAEPLLTTVALNVMALASVGALGVQLTPLMRRSGLGAQLPLTSSSATWPAGAPELAVKFSWTAVQAPEAGTVTLLPLVAGLNE